MSGPSIGVVIPAFNREDTIVRAVRSALDQTRPPARIVVIDDGSTDGTAARVRSIGSGVELVVQPNSGASMARNHGVSELTTDWVAFLDSDDVWEPAHLDRIADAIAATDGAADLYFDDAVADEFPDGTTLWMIAGFEPTGPVAFAEDASEWVLLPLQPIAIMSSVIRRSRYVELGGMWPELPTREDTHLIFRLGLGRPACAVAGVGSRLTADGGQATRLTSTSGPGSQVYARCSVRLYRDLLERSPRLPATVAASLTARLVDAEIADASLHLRRGDLRGAAALVRAARLDPGAAVRRTLSAVSRGRTESASSR